MQDEKSLFHFNISVEMALLQFMNIFKYKKSMNGFLNEVFFQG